MNAQLLGFFALHWVAQDKDTEGQKDSRQLLLTLPPHPSAALCQPLCPQMPDVPTPYHLGTETPKKAELF